MEKTRKAMIFMISGVILFAHVGMAQENAQKMKPALIVIDIQKTFFISQSPEDRKTAPDVINGAIQLFRQYNYPVIRVYHSNPEWGLKPGADAFQFIETIQVKEDDPQIIKTYGSAFTKTDLEKVLREKGCNTLFLCGLSATGCVLATYFGAKDRDFDVFMIKDGLLSSNVEHTAVIQEICYSVDNPKLKLMLEKAQK